MGFIALPKYRWPGGEIRYSFDPKLASDLIRKKIVEACMSRWEHLVAQYSGKGTIQFTRAPATEDGQPWVEVVDGQQTNAGTLGTRNANSKGRIKFMIAPGDLRNIPHELGHIVGLGHEHARPDSVLRGKAQTFGGLQLKGEQSHCVMHGKYDIMSIMHYECRLDSNLMTKLELKPGAKFGLNTSESLHSMIRKQPTTREVIAGVWGPSPGDLAAISAMYQ